MLLKNGGLLFAALCLALALGECILRVSGVTDSFAERAGRGGYVSEYDATDEQSLHTYSSNTKSKLVGRECTYIFSTNKEDCNDKEWAVRKSDTTRLRVLFVGDSFTDNEGGNGFSFERTLESKIDSLEVMNGGVAGSDPFFEYQLFHERLIKYKPDMVFVFLNISDITDVIVRGGFERFDSNGKPHYKVAPRWESLYAKIHLVRAVAKAFLSRQFLLPEEEKKARLEAIDKIEKCLDRFQSTCAENSIKCVFVFLPVKSEICKGIMDTDPIMKYAERANYPTIDMYDFFRKNNVSAANAKYYYGKYDGHNNSTGYAMVAKGLQQYFEDSVFVKKHL